MHYTGPVYRPPPEADTPLLEITYGCSWNRCSFCTMYDGQKFGISPLEDVESNLQELSRYYPKNLKKIYVENGDAFALQAHKLLEIADLIHKYFPEVETIACYASIRNIKPKSVEELKKLRAAGYDCFYIGLETAYDPALNQMRKGYTQKDEYDALKKLEDAGISYNAIIMFGVAGKGNYRQNAEETIKMLNRFKPRMILTMSTAVQDNSPLADMRDNGEFVVPTEREMLQEELMYLENLKMDDDCLYFGAHVYNISRITKYFKYQEDMIRQLKEGIENIDKSNPGLLDTVLPRGNL